MSLKSVEEARKNLTIGECIHTGLNDSLLDDNPINKITTKVAAMVADAENKLLLDTVRSYAKDLKMNHVYILDEAKLKRVLELGYAALKKEEENNA